MNTTETKTESSPRAKSAAIKTLAIVGFFALIGFIVWLGVQGIRHFPSAFSSLASIAETVGNYKGSSTEPLTIETKKNIVNSGDEIEVTWTDLKKSGTYDFSYRCIQGISLMVKGADGVFVPIPCAEGLSLTSEAHGLFISLRSNESRFVEVPFTLTFTAEGSNEPSQKAEGSITVVNAVVATSTPAIEGTISTSTKDVNVTKDETASTTPTIPTTSTKPPVSSPSTPVSKPVTTPVITYPVSNPSGYSDLQITFLAVGSVDSQNYFTPRATYSLSMRNALRFEVKNIGTKTSSYWNFVTNLPDTTYTSPLQAPLQPGEKVTFTMGFTVDKLPKNNTAKIIANVVSQDDRNALNNTFSWSVGVEK